MVKTMLDITTVLGPDPSESGEYLTEVLHVWTADDEPDAVHFEVISPKGSADAPFDIEVIRELHAKLGKWLCEHDFPD